MTFEELKELNSEKPRIEVVYKALMEGYGMLRYYRRQLSESKQNYWKGKISYQTKQIRIIEYKLKDAIK